MVKNKINKTPVKQEWALKKHVGLIFVIILSVLFFSNYSRIFDEKIDMNGDNIIYYSLGKSINEGSGFTNTMGFTESPHTHFPPGYPYFIAFVMKFFPNNIMAVKVANGILLFFSMILLFLVLSALCKNYLIAFTAVAFTVSQYTILRFATIMMSEILFLFFSLLVVLIIIKWKPEKIFANAKKRWLDISILLLMLGSLSYIYFIRTMGLAFILAVIVYYGCVFTQKTWIFFRTKKRAENIDTIKEAKTTWVKYAIVFGLVVIAFIIPKTSWDARNKKVGVTQSNYVENFHRKPNGQSIQGLSDWGERVSNNVNLYVAKWIPAAVFGYTAYSHTGTEIKSTAAEWIKGIFICLLLILGLFKLPKGKLLLFLYLGATMSVLLIWPEQYGGHRYMLAIIPFIIFLFIYGGYSLLAFLSFWLLKKNNKKSMKGLVIVSCLIFTLIAYPSYSKSIKTAAIQAKPKDYVMGTAQPALVEYLDAIRWVKANTIDSTRVSTRKPELFYIYSGGRKSATFPYYATPEEVITNFTNNKINYVIIDRWFRHAYATVIPAVQKYQEKFKIVHQINALEKDMPPTYVLEFNSEWGYTGEIVDEIRQGKGKFVFQDGRVYTGDFANNMFNGRGTITDTNGNILAKGVWKDNSLVKPE